MSADAVGPPCVGRRAGHPLLYHSQPLLGHVYRFDLDTAEGQLFLNRVLASLQRPHWPGPGREKFVRGREPQSAAASGCLGSSAGPCCARDAVALDRLGPPEIVATVDSRWPKLMTESPHWASLPKPSTNSPLPGGERVPQIPRRPVPAEPGSLANVLEHSPDLPRTQRRTGGRGEYPAGVLPLRSGSLPLSRLVHLPLPAMPLGHPSAVREHAPVLPGCGYRVSD